LENDNASSHIEIGSESDFQQHNYGRDPVTNETIQKLTSAIDKLTQSVRWQTACLYILSGVAGFSCFFYLYNLIN
jgi:hypothetical protein